MAHTRSGRLGSPAKERDYILDVWQQGRVWVFQVRSQFAGLPARVLYEGRSRSKKGAQDSIRRHVLDAFKFD